MPLSTVSREPCQRYRARHTGLRPWQAGLYRIIFVRPTTDQGGHAQQFQRARSQACYRRPDRGSFQPQPVAAAVQINDRLNNAQHHFQVSCQWRWSCRRNGCLIMMIWEKYLTTNCIGAITTASDQDGGNNDHPDNCSGPHAEPASTRHAPYWCPTALIWCVARRP